MRAILGIVSFSAAFTFLAVAAHAAVTEPNGVVVPTDRTGGGELRLDAFFLTEAETIDWRADAYPTPATFSPLCGFRATLKRVDSGSKYGVGWYNVDAAASSPPTQVFEIVPQNATPGQVFTGDDIRASPNYAGGLIGFALMRSGTPAFHYSESKWNTVCNSGACSATPGNWVLALTYQSKKLPNAWYMGFEDGQARDGDWDNDGDFNDSLFLFEGLACAGAGEPCNVPGVSGACVAGLTECTPGGSLECKQVVKPNQETCDGIDNDCSGGIDDADGICPEKHVCFQGQCVPNCGSGEFTCRGGKVCAGGVCVDPRCADKKCADGQACVEGQCVAPCDGVVCPGDTQCILGRCVDLCAGVSCAGGRVCQGGVCVESCACRGCNSGLSCQGGAHPSAGKCVVSSCIDAACAPGEACNEASGGACAPLCNAGVVCPRGQVCTAGVCAEAPPADGGAMGTGGTGIGGISFGGAGGSPPTGGTHSAAGGTGNAAGTAPSQARSVSPTGCGCRVEGRDGGGSGAAWFGLGLAFIARRRAFRRLGSNRKTVGT